MSIIGNPIMAGSGGKNISSIIISGLSSTDTVTCTKDGKSYTATWDETDQHWEIVGLPLGTFTVTATNGTKTTTETVLIDIAGVYEIEMDFKLWLYKFGDEYTDITGGWSIGVHTVADGLATVIKNDSNVYMNTPSAVKDECPLTTNIKIDLTDYSKLYATFTNITGYPGNNSPVLRLSANPSARGFAGTDALQTQVNWDGNITREILMDISSLSDERYITVGITSRDNYPVTSAYVTQVWLE